jgi:hypothetical protein
MSEPLSSTEIEDVLSSIRRLVSDDIRPPSRMQAAEAQVAGDKLILTPALRVVEGPTDADTPPMFVATARVQHHVENFTNFGQVVASVGAAVDASPDDWEAETGDALVSERDFAAAWAGPAAVESVTDADHGVLQITAGRDHFEYQDTVVDAPVVRTAAVAEDVPAWAQQDGQDELTDEVEAVIHNGVIEPDPVWADAAAASAIAGLADPRDEVDEQDDELEGETRFNEDVLRELVRDILREELAGKMGERITRNIRKLVRTEISRALMTQDIE